MLPIYYKNKFFINANIAFSISVILLKVQNTLANNIFRFIVGKINDIFDI